MDLNTFPAERLEGRVLRSGWTIDQKILRPAGATGGNFGVSYFASRGQTRAFVKAIDFRRAFGEADFIQALNQLTGHILWERSLMEFCRGEAMSRVVTLLDYEDIILEEDQGDQTKKICCFVFEIGEGDLRRKFDFSNAPLNSWRLSVLRDVALALDQLHRRGIAHLDVKPSNVISLESTIENSNIMKLGDLGRSIRRDVAGPFDDLGWPGDTQYAPPEKWYRHKCSNWRDERESADAYQLGSIFVFLYAGISLNDMIFAELPNQFHPYRYNGEFDNDLISVLKQAITKSLTLRVFPELPAQIKLELQEILLELTAPDPKKRGDKSARRQGIVGIDRYHQKFFRLAKRMAIEERRVPA